MNRVALRALAFDLLCVVAMAIIGTNNHKTDTGISGILFVAAPFLIATTLSRVFMRATKKDETTVVDGVTVVLFTVAIGMILRRFVFDRGTATAFVIVAIVFLGTTMLGWRALISRRSANQ
jgi:FtsH-binding integral membrane protein